MDKLRYWFIILTVWLVFLFNIERLIRPVDITKFTYFFVALVALVALVVPGAQRIPMWVLTGVPSVLLIMLQIWFNDPVLGAELPVTITEISSVVLTGLLARRTNDHLYQFEEVVAKIITNYVGSSAHTLDEEQSVMYKELKRARLYKRPLSILTIKLAPESLQLRLPHILQQYKTGLLHQMATAGVIEALDHTLFETDIIAYYKDKLVVVLPELSAENLEAVVQRVRQRVKTDTELELLVGQANYPEDAVTFETLLTVATERLDDGQPAAEQLPPALPKENVVLHPKTEQETI